MPANFIGKKVDDPLPVLGHWQFAHHQQKGLGGRNSAREGTLKRQNNIT
jgi:hypothetical protein